MFKQFKSDFKILSSGFSQNGFDAGSNKIHFVKNPKVALLTGEGVSSTGAGEVWHLFEQELNKKITLINAKEFDNTDFKSYNTIIIPDGKYKFLNTKDAASSCSFCTDKETLVNSIAIFCFTISCVIAGRLFACSVIINLKNPNGQVEVNFILFRRWSPLFILPGK